MRHKYLILLFLVLNSQLIFSQAGVGVYRFLDLPVSSRMSALGGDNISLHDNDLSFAFLNPSLLTEETHQVISLNYSSYISDIKFGSVMYGHNFTNKDYAAVGIQYVDLGTFDRRDRYDNPLGTFTAKDMALYLVYARPLNKYFSIGGTLKPIYSAYESYTSYGVALDGGISYVDSTGLFNAGLVFRNLGTQLKTYTSDDEGQNYEPLAFDIQLGASYRLKHAPFRFSMTLNNLNRWDLAYQSTNQPSGTNTNVKFIDMAFRHTSFGFEFIPTNTFYVAVGYNHRRRQEMAISGLRGTAGFSFGGGIKLYKFNVGFGMNQFLSGVSTYQFSISTALKEFAGL